MHPFVEGIIVQFKQEENEQEAVKMSQYMRNKFSYFGLRAPQMRAVTKSHLTKNGYPEETEIPVCIQQLFEENQRELQIVALSLMDFKLKQYHALEDIEVIEYMISTKSWWDTVDYIASNHVGIYMIKYPEQIQRYIEKWLNSDNIWLKRTAILFQLKYKTQTDFELMKEIMKRCFGTNEFFINKAIGWALREYSKVNKVGVLSFVDTYNEQLSNLSKREALKYLRSKKID